MRLRNLLVAPALAGALLLSITGAASAASVASPGAATQVREYQGTLVFSRYDATAQQWRLAIRRPGQAAEDLPVAPADRAFDADIGPDAKGRPELIYTRCDETCDLFVYSLAGGGERPVRNANDPEHDDTAPTLWGGRIAWARIYGEQRDRYVVVYTKTLTAPRSRPSTRLPGVPLRRCGDFRRTCGPTTGRTVESLELSGNNLAEVVDYGCKGCAGIAQTELRLVDVAHRTTAQIAFQVSGLAGQSFAGPSFHAGVLSWYRACLADDGSCHGITTPFRYDLRTRRTYQGEAGPTKVWGFADTGDQLYEVTGCNYETDPKYNAACSLDEVEAPSYDRVPAPLRD